MRPRAARGLALAAAVVLAVAASETAAQPAVPAGWLLSGGNPDLYRLRVDREVRHAGEASLRLSARGNRRRREWAVAVQIVDATPYRGKRVRLAGFLRSEEAGSGGLWLRVDGILDGEAALLGMDNTDDRRLRDTEDWTEQTIVVEVPPEAVAILFGAMLEGDGDLWVDDLEFGIVDGEVPVTAEPLRERTGRPYERPPVMLPGPRNLSFEEAASGP